MNELKPSSVSAFDASNFVEFDVDKGKITSTHGTSLNLLPTRMLDAIDPSDELARLATDWGRDHGFSLKKTLTAEAGIEALANHLGGTLATLGLGQFVLEVYGDALLLRGNRGGASSTSTRLILSKFVSGYLRAITDRKFEVVFLGDEDGAPLFFGGNKDATSTCVAAIDSGKSPLEAIRELEPRSES